MCEQNRPEEETEQGEVVEALASGFLSWVLPRLSSPERLGSTGSSSGNAQQKTSPDGCFCRLNRPFGDVVPVCPDVCSHICL